MMVSLYWLFSELHRVVLAVGHPNQSVVSGRWGDFRFSKEILTRIENWRIFSIGQK